MTSQQPAERKQQSTKRAVRPKRLQRVAGAGRVKAAVGPQQRRKNEPVQMDRSRQKVRKKSHSKDLFSFWPS